MIKSMTGYGRAEKVFDEYKITVEVKSVNNRYLDYNIRAYKQYSFVEEAVRDTLTAKLSRGKVDVFLQYDANGGDDKIITVNEQVAKGYYDALSALSKAYNLENVTLSQMAALPDIFNIEKCEQDKDRIISDTKQVLTEALDDLTDNRQREGARLKAFFDTSVSEVKGILEVIKNRSPETVNDYTQKMRERISELLDGVQYDESRLLTEVAIFADKVNITEEIIRFESHLKEYELLMNADVPVGRKLDFIIQELNREANTMGSKCNDITISKAVVNLKAEIEKLREQIQNIE